VLAATGMARLNTAAADNRASPATADTQPASTKPAAIPPAFKHRGFYFHCGWAFDHPFAPRSWSQADYQKAFELLRRMGFDTVMYWPQIEAIPAPISEPDAAALRNVRNIIADARAAGLRCWLVMTPNLTSPPEIVARPFMDRNPYKTYQTVHLDDPQQRDPFLAHRTAMIRVVNNADAYVTIDGDPGGYPGAAPQDFLSVFKSDRATLDQYGTDPTHQMVVPWIWAGWGRKEPLWNGDLTPYSRAAMAVLKPGLPEPWEMLPGRSHRQDCANGRINVRLAEELGLIDRSVILCYEAIEFEPTPPATVLQFDLIRRNLKDELHLAPQAAGVMGNAQQPIMALPNIYFFARAAWDPKYLERGDEDVLRDLAGFLGGPAELLVPAWQCLTLPLAGLPKNLPERLRAAKLTGEAAQCLPGGPQRYLDILAAQAASRIGLLTAIDAPAKDDEDCARRVADGTAALVNWWKLHHYVFDGDQTETFQWRFVRGDQVAPLQDWATRNARDKSAVASAAAKLLVERGVVKTPDAPALINRLVNTGP
jgi:hypothetical protein